MSAPEPQALPAAPLGHRHCDTEAALQTFAAALAPLCRAGDCLLLSGAVGAGKTSFARAFIRALAGQGTDVPSPTFTLVQTYDAAIPLWHYDLYRLKHAAELQELGLHEALQNGITLIEWPQIAEGWLPPDALHIEITPAGQGRQLTLRGQPAKWQTRIGTVL